MEITWLGILAIAILIFTGYGGYRKGFVREIMSFFFVFLALALAWMINPYVNDFMMKKTPAYERIQESCLNLIDSQNMDEEKSDEESSGGKVMDGTIQEETTFIDGLNLPKVLQKSLKDNNTAEVYKELAVDSFGDYVSGYLARLIVNGMSYLVSYILANLVIRLIGCVLNAIAELPLINGANRLTGALVGVAKGIVFLWIALLILTVLCSTETGKTGLALVEKDSFLRVVYRYDVLVNAFLQFFGK